MRREEVRCVSCGRAPEVDPMRACVCGGSFEIVSGRLNKRFADPAARLGVWRYASALPTLAPAARVSIDEGGTPLHRCPNLEEAWGVEELWIKNEGLNPTGSFKDRGMTVAVSLARSEGYRRVACASTGNTAASAAAYARRAGLACEVLLPKGKVASGKLGQVRMYGAAFREVSGSFDDALATLLAERSKETYLVNSLNPYRLEGQKTLAFEVWEQLSGAPDQLWLPVGNAGNIGAIWKGFNELAQAGLIEAGPRFVGAQAKGAAPLVHAGSRASSPPVVASPKTVASAINIGRPASWDKAVRAVRESRGEFVSVTDREILSVQRELASSEGLLVEPASAAPLAALRRAAKGRRVKGTIVVVCTGHGLKDPSVFPG